MNVSGIAFPGVQSGFNSLQMIVVVYLGLLNIDVFNIFLANISGYHKCWNAAQTLNPWWITYISSLTFFFNRNAQQLDSPSSYLQSFLILCILKSQVFHFLHKTFLPSVQIFDVFPVFSILTFSHKYCNPWIRFLILLPLHQIQHNHLLLIWLCFLLHWVLITQIYTSIRLYWTFIC